MTSQAQIYDKIYAERSPEFMQKQRIANEEYARRQSKEQISKQYTAESLLSQTGQSSIIFLHHLTTRRQIGEAVKVHYKSHNILMFELLRHPGKMLRVNSNGKVDFASVQDDTAVFLLDATYSGSLYFLSVAYSKNINVTGGIGWYLYMSEQGKLSGDGAKNELSQWTMINAAKQPLSSITNLPHTDNFNNSTKISSIIQKNESNIPMSTYNGGFPGVNSGKEVLMKYFRSDEGVKFLQQPEYLAAYKLFCNREVLSKILHRPDWPLIANRFEDYTTSSNIPLVRSIVNNNISFSELKQFYENGYVVCRNVISKDLLHAATKIVNYWISKSLPYNNTPSTNNAYKGVSFLPLNQGFELMGDITSDLDILALYYKSPLIHILQYMLGDGDVEKITSAQIITTFPTLELIESPALYGDKWVIDGFTNNGGHSPFTLLVGVALTDINEINHGNFCVHSTSHLILFDEYLDHVKKKKVLFSENPNNCTKPDLGEPNQLVMKAGDIFLCTQRCAYLHSINNGANPSTIVYFRVSHVDHAILKHSSLDSIWVEYKSASYYLESSEEDLAKTSTFLDLVTPTTTTDSVVLNDDMKTDSKSNLNKKIHDFLGGSENQDFTIDNDDDDSTFLLSSKQKKIVLDLLANDNESNDKSKPNVTDESELWGTFPEKHSLIHDISCDSHDLIDWSGTNPMLKVRTNNQQQLEINNSTESDTSLS